MRGDGPTWWGDALVISPAEGQFKYPNPRKVYENDACLMNYVRILSRFQPGALQLESSAAISENFLVLGAM